MARGILTTRVKKMSKKFLGRKIDTTELRLMPYLQYTMMNNQRLDVNKVNQEERDILRLLKDAGHIEGGAGGLSMTRDYWDFINDVLWYSYVIQEDDKHKEDSNGQV
jgi:hypothetical protein